MAGPPTRAVPARFVGSSIEGATEVYLPVGRGCRAVRALLLAPDDEAAFAWAAGVDAQATAELVVVPARPTTSTWHAVQRGSLSAYRRPDHATRACLDGYDRLLELEADGRLQLSVMAPTDVRLAGRSTDRLAYRYSDDTSCLIVRERGEMGQPDRGHRIERLELRWGDDGSGMSGPDGWWELEELFPPSGTGAAEAGSAYRAGPPVRRLRPYQEDAVRSWVAAGGRGIMALATGTGKTFTAVAAIEQALRERERGLVVAVLAPQVHLVDQWTRELRWLPGRTTACHTSTERWRGAAETDVALVRAGQRPLAVLAATHDTAALPAFLSLLEGVPAEQLMLVVDEAHHFATRGTSGLPEHPALRLGLTATPPGPATEGGRALLEHLGPIVADYGIGDAIRDGHLCPYRYRTHPVTLTEDELGRFREVSEELGQVLARSARERDRGRLEDLLKARSAIVDEATGKLEKLGRLLDRRSPDRTIVYCSGRPQLEAVLSLCWDRGIGAHPFTGEEPAGQRRTILERFAAGRIPALIAIRCLDEGVDVPAALEAYLLRSSTNPAQAVQRRGRLLRPHPGKQLATIHDLVIATTEPELRELESQRVRTFARDAVDGDATLATYGTKEVPAV